MKYVSYTSNLLYSIITLSPFHCREWRAPDQGSPLHDPMLEALSQHHALVIEDDGDELAQAKERPVALCELKLCIATLQINV